MPPQITVLGDNDFEGSCFLPVDSAVTAEFAQRWGGWSEAKVGGPWGGGERSWAGTGGGGWAPGFHEPRLGPDCLCLPAAAQVLALVTRVGGCAGLLGCGLLHEQHIF